MASPEPLGDISATNPSRHLAGLARHATGSEVKTDQQTAPPAPLAGIKAPAGAATQQVPAPAQAPQEIAAAGTGRLDLVVMAPSYETATNSRERSRTHPRPAPVPDAADMGTTAAVGQVRPSTQAPAPN